MDDVHNNINEMITLSTILPHRSKPKSQHPMIHETDEKNFQLSRRQLAEIQVLGILNDPELSLPIFDDDTRTFKLEEVAFRLQCKPWFVQRLVGALGLSSANVLNMCDIHKITRVLTGSFDARVLLFFNMIDTDGDRYMKREELFQFFKDYTDDIQSFNKSDEKDREIILNLIVDKFKLTEASYIDFDQFYELIINDRLLLETISRFTIHPNWFAKEEKNIIKNNVKSSWTLKRIILNVLRKQVNMYQSLYDGAEEKLSRDYLYGYFSRVLFLFIYLTVAISLFIFVLIYRIERHTNWLQIIARICGMQLNFNCILMMLLMCRNTARLIRTSRHLHAIVPIDDTVAIHAALGRWIMILSVIHTICYMCYDSMNKNGYTRIEIMFTTRAHIGRLGMSPLSGFILLFVLIIMGICSMEFVRRGRYFELFDWTHMLYIVFYGLLLLHARNFWYWFIVPGTIFLLEKLFELFKRCSPRTGRTLLRAATIEEANVVKLTICRPSQFNFMPGDYIAINIPQVAHFEWHPFTLSSAPEDKQLLTVHIQAIGNWTRKVFDRYKKLSNVPENNDLEAETEYVWIRGPYSSSARYIFHCSHAILIGAGIGVAPYASVLSSLLAQYRYQHNSGSKTDRQQRLTKVDFVWINRSIRNFEWFLKLLSNFEQEQELYENQRNGRFLNIHLYFTDIKQDDSFKSVPLNLVARVYEQAYQKDIFTHLKTKTHVGRPEWNSLFDKILARDNENQKRDADVFFCGPKTMGNIIKTQCNKHKIYFHQEKF